MTITVDPKDRTEEFEIAVSGVNRVRITEVSRDSNTGEIVIDVRGTSGTHFNHKDGDTTIEAKIDGSAVGAAKVVVIIPDKISGPCPPADGGGSSSSSSSSSRGCPDGGVRVGENKLLNVKTIPAWPDVPEGQYIRITAYFLQYQLMFAISSETPWTKCMMDVVFKKKGCINGIR